MTILFVQGVNDRGLARLGVRRDGKPRLHLDGSCNVLNMVGFTGVESGSMMIYGANTRQPPVSFRVRPELVFNEISDPDSHAAVLGRCADLCAHLDVPVVNPPERILETTRDRVSQSLAGIEGVRMPRTVRFQAESPDEVFATAGVLAIEPPFIVRVAGDHGGKSMVRIRGREDRERLHVFPFGDTDLYLTEFVDYADAEGFYRKHRVVMVGGEAVVRHTLFDSGWNVHARSRKANREAGSENELDRLLRVERELLPKARPALEEIARRLRLDWFGIDCHIAPDGEVLVFEANANMNVFYNAVPELNSRVDHIRDRLCALLSDRLGREVGWAPREDA